MAKRWLTILEGDDPRTARPIMATEDASLIREVGDIVARRVRGTPDRTAPRVLPIRPPTRAGA